MLAAGAGSGRSLLLVGGGLVACWVDCGRGWWGGVVVINDSCGTGAATTGV